MISLGRTADYDEMLTRIALATILAAVISIWRLRATSPIIESVLSSADKLPAIGPLKDFDKLPTGTLVLGILIGLLFRAIKLHDRISDALKIRKNFDINNILIPIVASLDGRFSEEHLRGISRHRDEWMRELFYAYATSSKDKAKIDESLIRQALDWWTCSWIALESGVVLFLASLVAYFAGAYRASDEFLFACLALVAAFYILVRFACSDVAEAEVRAIISDETRCDELRRKLDALLASGSRT